MSTKEIVREDAAPSHVPFFRVAHSFIATSARQKRCLLHGSGYAKGWVYYKEQRKSSVLRKTLPDSSLKIIIKKKRTKKKQQKLFEHAATATTKEKKKKKVLYELSPHCEGASDPSAQNMQFSSHKPNSGTRASPLPIHVCAGVISE